MIELKISLQPKQIQFSKSIDQFPVTLFGGARGGGKSYALRNILLIRRLIYPKSVGGIFRKTYPELEANHIRPLFQQFPILRQFYNESKKVLTLPNQSVLKFCHCESEKDLSLYQGQEFTDLGIDEVGSWTEQMFRTLHGSNRSSIPGTPVRCAMTANPGGEGHQWLKRLFIEKRFNERERPQDYNFIKSLVSDNKALIDNDPDYVHRLKAEPNETLRKAFLEGDWDLMAGQYFSELRREIHFIKSFPIPPYWNRFAAYDFGFNHPAAFGWFAVDTDGNVYLYRELIKAQMRIDQFAHEINKHDDTKDCYPIVAGHDCWAKKNVMNAESIPTIADEFKKHSIILKQAVIDRIQGATQVRNYLAWQGRPNHKPRLYIMDNCPITFDCLSRMIHDPDKIEDVLKVDSIDGNINSGDDPYDMLRMALMTRPFISEPILKYEIGSQEWGKQEEEKMLLAAEEKMKQDLTNNYEDY